MKTTSEQVAELKKLLLDAQATLDQLERGLASLEERLNEAEDVPGARP